MYVIIFWGHLMNLCAVHFRFHGLQSCWVFQIRSYPEINLRPSPVRPSTPHWPAQVAV